MTDPVVVKKVRNTTHWKAVAKAAERLAGERLMQVQDADARWRVACALGDQWKAAHRRAMQGVYVLTGLFIGEFILAVWGWVR